MRYCGLQDAAVHSRPDIAIKVAACLQKGITSATVETLLEGNRVLREAQAFVDTSVIVRPLPMQEVCFASFGDASFASAKQLSAQPLWPVPEALHETRQQSFLQSFGTQSKSVSAEAYSMSSSLDKLTWIRTMWGYIKSPDFDRSKA